VISDYELQCAANEHVWDDNQVVELATELLQLREEKRKAAEAYVKSWEGAPDWAKYRARDFNGDLHWYANLPNVSDETPEWMFSDDDDDGRYELVKPDYSDWRDTLEVRP
jgi:hypothetical protein